MEKFRWPSFVGWGKMKFRRTPQNYMLDDTQFTVAYTLYSPYCVQHILQPSKINCSHPTYSAAVQHADSAVYKLTPCVIYSDFKLPSIARVYRISLRATNMRSIRVNWVLFNTKPILGNYTMCVRA